MSNSIQSLNETQLELLKRYDGSFRKLDDKANALKKDWQKIADSAKKQIDTTNKLVNDKVKWADTQVSNLISNAHSSIKFKVEGDRNHFYPVIISTSYNPFNFFILRDSVHWDGTWYGRCVIQINGLTTHWGHGANYTRVITNNHTKTRFLARAYENYETGWIVLYLRGNTTYRFISDWGYANFVNCSAKNKKWVWSAHKEQWIDFRAVDDGTDTTYQDKFKSNWVMDLAKGGCQMVARKSGGKIIDTKNR